MAEGFAGLKKTGFYSQMEWRTIARGQAELTPSHSSFRKITLAAVFSGYYSNLMGLQVASDG